MNGRADECVVGEMGQIASARVVAERGRDPRLRVVVVNEPEHVFGCQPELAREQRVYLIHPGLESLRITPES